MIQDGCLEFECSFLIRPRFQCSPRLSEMLLCGSVTPRSLSFRTHWMLKWGLTSWLQWTPSTTLNCPSFFELIVSSPSLSFAVGSFWTVWSPSAGAAMLASCIVRPADWGYRRCWMIGIHWFAANTSSLGWFAILAGPMLSQAKHVSLHNRVPVFNTLPLGHGEMRDGYPACCWWVTPFYVFLHDVLHMHLSAGLSHFLLQGYWQLDAACLGVKLQINRWVMTPNF